MEWEAIGATGEVLGALILVVTVAYLAVQVRYARQATIDQNILSRAQGVQEQMLSDYEPADSVEGLTADDYPQVPVIVPAFS